MSNAILKINDLSITLPKNADRQFAVEDVNLEVRKGEILCIVGESGSGKSVMTSAIFEVLASAHNKTIEFDKRYFKLPQKELMTFVALAFR